MKPGEPTASSPAILRGSGERARADEDGGAAARTTRSALTIALYLWERGLPVGASRAVSRQRQNAAAGTYAPARNRAHARARARFDLPWIDGGSAHATATAFGST